AGCAAASESRTARARRRARARRSRRPAAPSRAPARPPPPGQSPYRLEDRTATNVANGSVCHLWARAHSDSGRWIAGNTGDGDRLISPWWALRAGIGLVAFLAGLDKFFNLLADWPAYLSPAAAHLLPMSAASFMHLVGIVEMAVGATILAGQT